MGRTLWVSPFLDRGQELMFDNLREELNEIFEVRRLDFSSSWLNPFTGPGSREGFDFKTQSCNCGERGWGYDYECWIRCRDHRLNAYKCYYT